MSERKLLSTILQDAGRITESEVERALEYQRLHGGYFGEALVALGVVSREEVDWALASQFDLPYIFPDPDTVDPEVAALVAPDWALENLAVPIRRAGDSLVLVVANPLLRDVVEELQQETGLQVDLALAAPARIRALIRTVYGASDDRPARRTKLHSLAEFFGQALAAGAERFGVSARGSVAWGWYAHGPVGTAGRRDGICRLPLASDWKTALAAAVQPLSSRESGPGDHGQRVWTATLRQGGSAVAVVDVAALVGAGGVEYLFRPQNVNRPGESAASRRLTLPSALIADLRILARSEGARIALAGDDPELVRALLGSLPLLALDEPARAVHLTERAGAGASGVAVLEVTPGEDLPDLLDDYAFDAVTVDLPADDFPLKRIAAAAPLAFVYLREHDWRDRLRELEFGWVLELAHDDRGAVAGWELSSVRVRDHGTD